MSEEFNKIDTQLLLEYKPIPIAKFKLDTTHSLLYSFMDTFLCAGVVSGESQEVALRDAHMAYLTLKNTRI